MVRPRRGRAGRPPRRISSTPATGVVCAMKTFVLLAGSLIVASATLLAGQGDAEKTPSIKDVMGKLHKGAMAPLAKLKTALKSESPNWTAIEKSTKDFVILGAAL